MIAALALLLTAPQDRFVYVGSDGRLGIVGLANAKLPRVTRVREPSVSPDHKKVVFWREGKGGDLFIADLSTGRSRLLRAGNYRSPSWTRDGKNIVFGRMGGKPADWEVACVSADGKGPARTILGAAQHAAGAFHPVRSPGTEAFVAQDCFSVFWVTPGSPGVRTVVMEDLGIDHPLTSGDVFTTSPTDAKMMAFTADSQGDEDVALISNGLVGAIYLLDMRGRKPHRITGANLNAQNPAWSADGQWIFFDGARSGRGATEMGVWKIRPSGTSLSLVRRGAREPSPF